MTPSRFVLFLLLSVCIVLPSWAQTKSNPWSFPKYKQSLPTTKDFPLKHTIVELKAEILIPILDQAPLRFSESARNKKVVLTLPLADGTLDEFSIVEAPVLHPDLGKKYPNIRSFAGQSIADPTKTVRFSWSPKGFQALVRAGEQTSIIDAYSSSNTINHAIYNRKDRVGVNTAFECAVKRHNERKAVTASNRSQQAGDCQLRTYRLALACTGEYAAFHGGTTADALAAMNATITRTNGVFEQELSVSLQIIPQNINIIFLNANTDPYSNFDGVEMLDENQQTIDQTIGSSNYDVGHVFSTGGGGIAGLGVVCNFRSKSEGVTGSDRPEGDLFDIDFVAHELGHQFGAEHTFNGNKDACSGNTWGPSAVEPGGGSTIMAYAGICGNQNIQSKSDVYFHAQSIEEISKFITSSGNGCAQITDLNNDPPSANAGRDHIIPKSTPFVLTGLSSDINGGALTFNWEQMDTENSTQPPLSNNSGGPLFRSNPPSTSRIRYFPDLSFLARNIDNRWEVLPSVAREMNFRFTARDNNSGGGCTEEDDMAIIVNDQAGPFLVASPNTNVRWIGGSREVVTWDVANTNVAPINATLVDILVSLDGGLSFPQTILSNAPNTGSAEIVVPNMSTNTARLMVRASENIFFDISDRNFRIEPVRDDFLVLVSERAKETCSELPISYSVDVDVSGSLDGTVALSTTGLPNGVEVAFSKNDFVPPSSITLTVTPNGTVAPGTYDFKVNVSGTTGTQSRNLSLTIVNESAELVLDTPTNNNGAVEPAATFAWNVLEGAEKYTLQIAKDAEFSNPISHANISANIFSLPVSLSTNTRYYWKVIAEGPCLGNKESGTFTFLTSNISCRIFDSKDIPLEISTMGSPTVVSTINIPDEGIVTDVNVLNLQIDHSFVSDIAVGLSSPSEDVAILLFFPCLFHENVDLNFDDDEAKSHDDIPCPPVGGGRYNPLDKLSVFNGTPVNGDWLLVVNDDADDDGGSLNSWSLEVCFLQETLVAALSVSAMTSDETCFGKKDGTASVTPLDGTGNYTFLWSNGATTSSLDQLAPGSYTVTVSDGVSDIVKSTTITAAPDIATLFETKDQSCSELEDGEIMAISQGDTDLSYFWPDGSTGPTFSNLRSGGYSVVVTETTTGCTTTERIEIDVLDPMIIDAEVQAVSCANGSDATIELTLSGGLPPYTFNANDLSNLSAGNYDVQVTDANNCVQNSMITVTEPSPVIIDFIAKPISRVNLTDGFINASASGGTGPYSYNWSNGTSGSLINGLSDGVYELTVTDQNGCLTTGSAVVPGIECSTISFVLSTEEISSVNEADGRITASIENAEGTYTYLWSTGANTSTISDLAAGSYSLTLTDEKGCTGTQTVVLNAIDCPPFNINFATVKPNCGSADGKITAMAIGNNGPYIYKWSTDLEGPEISDLSSGSYTVTVTDGSGCFFVSNTLLASDSDTTPPSIECPEDNVITNACNIPVIYELITSDACGTVELELMQGLESGEVFPQGNTLVEYRATDAAGNTASCMFNVTQTTEMSVAYDPSFLLPNTGDQVLFTYDLNCGNPNTVIADFLKISGGLEPYSFDVVEGSNGGSATNYLVNITDANGCLYQDRVNFLNSDFPQGSPSPILNETIEASTGGDGKIMLGIDDRFGITTFLWTKENITISRSQNLDNLEAGVYRLDMTDQFGCTYFYEYEVQMLTSTNQLLLEETVHILPNPTTGNFQIKINLPNPAAVTVELYDVNGRLLEAAINRENASIPIGINISHYPKGIYLAKISAENEVIVKRIVLL